MVYYIKYQTSKILGTQAPSYLRKNRVIFHREGPLSYFFSNFGWEKNIT